MTKYVWDRYEIKEVEKDDGFCFDTPEEAMISSLKNKEFFLYRGLLKIKEDLEYVKKLQETMIKSNIKEDMNEIFSEEDLIDIGKNIDLCSQLCIPSFEIGND